MWCNHTVVLTQLPLRRFPVLFYHIDQIFNMVINLSIAVPALPIHMLISFSVDEILLLRYMNGSTSFSGWLINEEIASSSLKHMNSVLSEKKREASLYSSSITFLSKSSVQVQVVHLYSSTDTTTVWKNYLIYWTVRSAEAVEYFRLHLCRVWRPPSKECLGYDIKPSDGKASVLELWGMWSILSLSLLLSPLWPGVVTPDRVLRMG